MSRIDILSADRSKPKTCYVSVTRDDCVPGSEQTFLHDTTNTLSLVGVVIFAPEGSTVMAIHDGVEDLISRPLPARTFAPGEIRIDLRGSRTRPGTKQVVTVKCGPSGGKIGVLFVVDVCLDEETGHGKQEAEEA